MREFYRQRDEQDVFRPVNLNELVTQVISLTGPRWQGQAQNRGAHIEVVTQFGEIPAIKASESDLREVLTNLIMNATDAITGQGRITITTSLGQNCVMLEVSDTGAGMSEETRLQCLEPFFTTKGHDGTGLGLAVVHGIVRRHGGAIEISSTPGEGSTFHLALPLAEDMETPEDLGESTVITTPQRILLVDDDDGVRLVIQEFLTIERHRVKAVASGAEAIDLLRTQTFDLVITDQAMPGVNGQQVAEAAKSLPAPLGVILLTGFGQVMQDTGRLPAEVDLVLNKPVTPQQLRDAITSLLRRQPA